MEIERVRELFRAAADEVAKVIVGQTDLVEGVLVALFSEGSVLIEDLPGLAKTLMARSFARVVGLRFARIQFTPDLMPSDVTGAAIYDQRTGEFTFRPGPVFANLLLGDEINRAPAKTQAALLEAMQERQVTVEGVTRPLDPPFLVIATQNPIEYEGTYPLPEAQLDRFMLRVVISYPTAEEERAMLSLPREGLAPSALGSVREVAGPDELRSIRRDIDETVVSDEVAGYVVDVVRRTRELPSVSLGASPRAAVHLLVASKAAARLAGRAFVTPDDVAGIATAALGHRLILTPEAELERFGAGDAIRAAIDDVPVPR